MGTGLWYAASRSKLSATNGRSVRVQGYRLRLLPRRVLAVGLLADGDAPARTESPPPPPSDLASQARGARCA
eukprot:6394030-Prymnesium_polylepis.1